LRWLIVEGYVTEYGDGRLFAAPPMAEAKPKVVKQPAPKDVQAVTAAAPSAELAAAPEVVAETQVSAEPKTEVADPEPKVEVAAAETCAAPETVVAEATPVVTEVADAEPKVAVVAEETSVEAGATAVESVAKAAAKVVEEKPEVAEVEAPVIEATDEAEPKA